LELEIFLAHQDLAGFIRLAFHDCIGGGCNGCINPSQPANKGLEKTVAALEGVYGRSHINAAVSRADLWAYAGHLAVKRALANSNSRCAASDCLAADPGLPFRFGRQDCPDGPNTTVWDDIPLATRHDDVDFFAREFGLTAEETAAIMGGHNLGQARFENSGYIGTFVPGQKNLLNNNYYKLLMRPDWQQVDATGGNRTSGPRMQWVLPGVPSSAGFMLNTDVGLVRNIQVDGEGRAACSFQSCPLAKPAPFVANFANSNDDFVRVFAVAVAKIQSRGSVGLWEVV
jgi:hypothetical protein